jgi:hypothetical protein
MNPLIVTRAPADVLPWSSAATTSSGTRSRVAILPARWLVVSNRTRVRFAHSILV